MVIGGSGAMASADGWETVQLSYITPLRKQRAMKVETILGEQFCHWLDYVWGWQHS